MPRDDAREPGDWMHLGRLLEEGGLLPPEGSELARLCNRAAIRLADPNVTAEELETIRAAEGVLSEMAQIRQGIDFLLPLVALLIQSASPDQRSAAIKLIDAAARKFKTGFLVRQAREARAIADDLREVLDERAA